MSLKKKIARATQNNCRLNCRVLKMKHSWDEVQSILDTACRKKKGCCHASCKHVHPSCQCTPKQKSPSPDTSCKSQTNYNHHKVNQNNTCNHCQPNPRSPFYPFF